MSEYDLDANAIGYHTALAGADADAPASRLTLSFPLKPLLATTIYCVRPFIVCSTVTTSATYCLRYIPVHPIHGSRVVESRRQPSPAPFI